MHLKNIKLKRLRPYLLLIILGLLISCSNSQPPGIDWATFTSALHNLKRVYTADQVIGCQQLRQLQGESIDDIAAVKDILDKEAVLAGADTIYYTDLNSGLSSKLPFRNKEIYEATAIAYRCK